MAERAAAIAPQGVDASLDTAGSGSLADLISIVGDAARVASVADYNAPALGATAVKGTANAQANLAAAAELGAAGSYTPRVQATYPLERIAEAHTHVQGGRTEGKIVITLRAAISGGAPPPAAHPPSAGAHTARRRRAEELPRTEGEATQNSDGAAHVVSGASRRAA